MTVAARTFASASSQYGDLPTGVYDWEYTQAWTWAGWINVASNASGCVLGKQDNTANTRGWCVFHRAGATSPTFAATVANTGAIEVVVRTTTEFAISTWRHVIVTYSGSGTAAGFHIYVDGVDQALTTIDDTLAANTIKNAVNAQIGARGGSAGATFFGNYSGRRFCLFSEVLSSANRALLDAGATKPSSIASCVGWWEFGADDDGTTAVRDLSENRRPLVLTGTSTTTSGPTVTALTVDVGTSGVRTLSGPMTKVALRTVSSKTAAVLNNQGYLTNGATPSGTGGDQIGPGCVLRMGSADYLAVLENATGVKSLDATNQTGLFDSDTTSIYAQSSDSTNWDSGIANQGVAASALINCNNLSGDATFKAAVKGETSVSTVWRDASTGTWYCLFHGGNNSGTRKIYLAKYTGSLTNGRPLTAGSWTVQNSGSPVITVGSAGSWKESGVADIYVLVSPDGYPVLDPNGKASAIFAGWNASGAYQVGLAQSSDNFLTVTESVSNPILPKTAGTWYSGAVYPCGWVYDTDLQKVCLWFGGAQSTAGTACLGIGFMSANLSDLTTWTEGTFNPVLTPTGASNLEAVGATTAYAVIDDTVVRVLYRADNAVSGASGYRGRQMATVTRVVRGNHRLHHQRKAHSLMRRAG